MASDTVVGRGSRAMSMGQEWRLMCEVLRPMEQAILVADSAGRILWVNPAFVQVTGYEAAEVVGRTPRLLKSRRHRPAFYRAIWAQLAQAGQWSGEIWSRRKSGDVHPEWLKAFAVGGGQGRSALYVGVFSDISARKNDEALIHSLRSYDSLTGLPNWDMFRERLEEAVDSARAAGRMAGVMLVDLDRFTRVNEALGSGAGDLILESMAERLVRMFGRSDAVARRGADQFGIVLPSVGSLEQASGAAQRLLELIARPLGILEQTVVVTASVGLGLFPEHGDDTAQLLNGAEAAVNRVKAGGGNGFHFYQPSLNGDGRRRLALASGLHTALGRGELFLHFQPQVDLLEQRVVGVEALVRWRHPELGLVLPSSFIPLAEESGAIVAIGEWVLREACGQVRRWVDEGYDLRLAVNLSLRQFRHGGLVYSVERALEESGLPSGRLELEVTESCLADDPAGAAQVLREVKAHGVEVSVDDFGTGYSSLSSLKRFPLDRLKIDRSFVENCCSDANDAAIVDAVIGLARALRLQPIAEGVETPGQLDFLVERDCRYAQGYLFSPPLEPAHFRARFAADGAVPKSVAAGWPC